MDLALELGMTVAGVKASMTTDELTMWAAYQRRKFLPARRVELYLARMAQVHVGGKLEDFLLGASVHHEPAGDTRARAIPAAAAASALASDGVRVIVVRKKRRL
jgi:hypothetical protein